MKVGTQCREQRQKVYIACEDMNFVWDEEEVLHFDQRWTEGAGILELAKEFKRQADEVAILIIDRARQGKIQPRANGVLGL